MTRQDILAYSLIVFSIIANEVCLHQNEFTACVEVNQMNQREPPSFSPTVKSSDLSEINFPTSPSLNVEIPSPSPEDTEFEVS